MHRLMFSFFVALKLISLSTYVCTSMYLLCIFVFLLACAIHKQVNYMKSILTIMMVILTCLSCGYFLFFFLRIYHHHSCIFFFFLLSFFRSFFLTLKKKAHARQKQNKVNIFSTKIIKIYNQCDVG